MRSLTRLLFLTLILSSAASAHNTTIISQIANAPGWRANYTYTGGDNFSSDRVLAGPGWKAGSPGSFTNGAAVYLWIDTTLGSHSSANGGHGPQDCPSPGTSTVTDGEITWKCLTRIDYSTITGYLWDDSAWRADTAYYAQQVVISDNPPRAYAISSAVSNAITAPYTCTSGSTAPTGTGNKITDGSCVWSYVTNLGYSSQTTFIPKQRYFRGYNNFPTSQNQDYRVGNIWYGGVSRQEYVDGANGEMDPIMLQGHSDWSPFYNSGDQGFTPCSACNDGTSASYPTAYTAQYRITLQAQSTDAFYANPHVRTNALAYNAANGVAVHSTSAYNAGAWNGLPVGLTFYAGDSHVTFYGLQMKSDKANAIAGPHDNFITVARSILDAPGACIYAANGPTTPVSDCTGFDKPYTPLILDASGAVFDTLIVMRGVGLGGMGLWMKYDGFLSNVTIVNLGGATNSTCFVEFSGWPRQPGPFRNIYCAGFTHTAALDTHGYATLTSKVDPITTTIPLSTEWCGCQATYARIGSEIMQVIRADKNTITVSRGAQGTTAAPHGAGDVIAVQWDTSTISASGGNATSGAPTGVISGPPFNTYQGPYYPTDLPNMRATCGVENASSCFHISPKDVFVNSLTDFRLRSGAPLVGAGVASRIPIGNITYTNSLDITGLVRPQSGRYSIGAWE
jgi:hypothetical protein